MTDWFRLLNNFSVAMVHNSFIFSNKNVAMLTPLKLLVRNNQKVRKCCKKFQATDVSM